MSVAVPVTSIGQNEFPSLAAARLYPVNTLGDGNCLFHALSDQLYGNQFKHAELRAGVIEHMRSNAAHFKQYIVVHPGGGTRRNPKRKNAGGYSTRSSTDVATAEEIDRTFENHLREMARGGTYGDNMEIAAFSTAYNVDVMIYRPNLAYMVSTRHDSDKSVAPVLHIAHHEFEHYSSVRNVDGPHTGLPHVKLGAHGRIPEVPAPKRDSGRATNGSWNIDAVRAKVVEGSGSVGDVISLRDHEKSTTPSTQGSSSVELDLDSDDEEPVRGPKRQNRRLSLATTIAKEKEDRSRDLTFRPKTGYLGQTQERSTASETKLGVTSIIIDDSEEEDWRQDGSRNASESTSFSTSSSERSAARKATSTGVRLKLSQPKKDGQPKKNGVLVRKPASSNRERPTVGAKAKTSTYKGTARECPPLSLAQRRLIQERRRHAGAGTQPLTTTQGNERTPVIENRIKVLWI